MPIDVGSLLFVLALSMLTIAVALPSVMGQVNRAARLAQTGVFLQATGWVLMLGSGIVEGGSWTDRTLSTLAVAGIASGLALNGAAFELWCGRTSAARTPVLIVVVLTLGYGIGFSNYAFRVGWANGLLALQMAMVAGTLCRKPLVPVGKWRWLLVVAFIAQMVVTAWRGVLGGFFTNDFPSFLTPHPVNITFALVANVTTVLSLAGILLAHRDEAARGLERLATLDGLTGLLNRRAWLQRSNIELAVSVRYGYPLAVFMIDLDNFKQINDRGGHEAGDHALLFFARALKAKCRAGDLVCRYGGEEFCVLMNRADHVGTKSFDQRIRAYLAEEAPRALGHELSYSAGIAVRMSADDTIEAMLRRADLTLYNAKALGRSRTLDARGEQLELTTTA
jgi:diguanylate cyclase (GGDEF)-like protein